MPPRAPLRARREPDEPVHKLWGAHDARRPGRTRVLGVRRRSVSVIKGTLFGFALDELAVGLACEGAR